jgi:hypothetical protein
MPPVHDLTQQAGFVFEAEVEQLGASTASGFAATSETAVVHITRIFKGPACLAVCRAARDGCAVVHRAKRHDRRFLLPRTDGIMGKGLVVREASDVPREPTMEFEDE